MLIWVMISYFHFDLYVFFFWLFSDEKGHLKIVQFPQKTWKYPDDVFKISRGCDFVEVSIMYYDVPILMYQWFEQNDKMPTVYSGDWSKFRLFFCLSWADDFFFSVCPTLCSRVPLKWSWIFMVSRGWTLMLIPFFQESLSGHNFTIFCTIIITI